MIGPMISDAALIALGERIADLTAENTKLKAERRDLRAKIHLTIFELTNMEFSSRETVVHRIDELLRSGECK